MVIHRNLCRNPLLVRILTEPGVEVTKDGVFRMLDCLRAKIKKFIRKISCVDSRIQF